MTQNLKLSEAMRLGAMTLPPVRGPVIDREVRDGRIVACGACAIGAALYAIHGDALHELLSESNHSFRSLIEQAWPWTTTVRPNGRHIVSMIIERFESWGQSRAQIADFIATIEPQGRPEVVADRSAAPHLETV